uniref:Uncharacterized protein n=1 Tax=Pararge aegeria TaxID=116150 RepID=S4NY75_9NEOP
MEVEEGRGKFSIKSAFFGFYIHPCADAPVDKTLGINILSYPRGAGKVFLPMEAVLGNLLSYFFSPENYCTFHFYNVFAYRTY